MDKIPYTPASFPLGKAWFACVVDYLAMAWDHTKFAIEHDINALGFETFAPREEKIIRRRGRKVKQVSPAFGPYMFVRFDREADDWGHLRPYDFKSGHGISGFVQIIKNNNIPIRVPDLLIDRLTRAVELGFFGSDPLPEGARVEVMEGQWAGFLGKIKRARPGKKAEVVMDLLCTLEIDTCFLRKL